MTYLVNRLAPTAVIRPTKPATVASTISISRPSFAWTWTWNKFKSFHLGYIARAISVIQWYSCKSNYLVPLILSWCRWLPICSSSPHPVVHFTNSFMSHLDCCNGNKYYYNTLCSALILSAWIDHQATPTTLYARYDVTGTGTKVAQN